MAWNPNGLEPLKTLLMVQQLRAGGSERQMTEIARSLDRRRFAPAVGVMRAGGLRQQDLDAAGVPVETFPVMSFMKPSLVRAANQLRGYLRRERVALFHSFDTPGNVFGVPTAKWAGVPVVLSSQRAHRELSPAGQLQVLRWTDRLVDAIVVNCEFLRRHLAEDEGVPADRIRLCYNGIDTSAFHRHVRPAEERQAGVLTAGVVCALRPEKNLGVLLEGFAQARRQRPELRLLVVGSGPEEPLLRQQAAELALGEACRFVPAQSAVAPWLQMIDIFVLPSRTEALSNSLMEAMACGCAAVASDVGGNPELVRPGETGLLFRQGDAADLGAALLQLAENAELRARVAGEGAGRIAAKFTLAASVGAMQAIYEEMLARKSSPSRAALRARS